MQVAKAKINSFILSYSSMKSSAAAKKGFTSSSALKIFSHAEHDYASSVRCFTCNVTVYVSEKICLCGITVNVDGKRNGDSQREQASGSIATDSSDWPRASGKQVKTRGNHKLKT